MALWELILIAVGLSTDAFAIAVCKGLSVRGAKLRIALICGLYFGVFQAVMPFVGWLLASRFADGISAFDHWIAFVLLAAIGGKMIWETIKGDDGDKPDGGVNAGEMLPLALATSIDALAVGISFAFLQVQIVPSVTLIGITTFLLSAVGVPVGAFFGEKLGKRAELAGGAVLILIGAKILIEHLIQ